MKMLNEYVDGDHFEGQLLVSSVSKGTNNLGGQYLNLELRDSSASIPAKKWEIFSNDENVFVSGNVINVVGEIIKYKETLQMKVLSGENVDLEKIDVNKFLKQPPIPKEELLNKFFTYVESVKNVTYRKLLDYFVEKYKEKLNDYPAAVSIHHEYCSGLLVHATTMADIGNYLAPFYDVDRDLLITSILLHDFGKFTELVGPVIYKYSLEGKLKGHISIMDAELEVAKNELNLDPNDVLLVQHCILSHHGQLDFGSPVLPLTKEAMLLSLIDNLDSKMVALNKALDEVKVGDFTNKVFCLDNRTFYKHK